MLPVGKGSEACAESGRVTGSTMGKSDVSTQSADECDGRNRDYYHSFFTVLYAAVD